MLLTLYYIAATWLQSWRIKKVCTQITEKLSEKASVVFYKVPLDVNEVTATLATSELCTNRSHARICDFLWWRGNQRGCSLLPVQCLHLGPWVSFPSAPNLIPFDFQRLDKQIDIDEGSSVHLLLETDIVPNQGFEEDEVLMIEEYGKPIAWKVDSHFAVLLESDINHFTKLIMSTFMQDNFSINDRLPLIRIESVNYEGEPQPFDLLKNHLRKQLTSRAMRQLSTNEWEKHLAGLRSLSVLAQQATEFEYNKNRTEGKTGIVKPDLIPSKTIIDEIDTQKLIPSKKPSPKHSPIKMEAKVSPIRHIPEKKALNSYEEQGIKLLEAKQKTPEKSKSPTTTTTPITTSQKQPSPAKVISKPEEAFINLKEENHLESPAKSQIHEPPPTTPLPSTSINLPTDKPDYLPTNKLNDTPEVVNISKPTPVVIKPLPKAADIVTTNKNNTKRPSLVRNKGSLVDSKPPNVLVYSDSATMRDSVISLLRDIVEIDTYTIYPLTSQQAQQKIWIDNTSLLVICGTVDNDVGIILLDYFLKGGKVLSLCSDLLHIILPTYRTAEVREHELVQFSYDKWQKVKMMHHIFCYQPSPVKKHFSHDGEDPTPPPPVPKKPALVCPRSVEVKDLQGAPHSLDVKVLGTEETWNTPSLLLASNMSSGGKAVFSQVHLEADPSQFESDENKYAVLKQSDKARLEIFSDLLKSHLNVIVRIPTNIRADDKNLYKCAYFLGRHESKFDLLDKLKQYMEETSTIKTKNLTIKFCGKSDTPPKAKSNLLPILIHSCPEDFSTVDYFDNLRSNYVGRLVIYAPIITSSMFIISDLTLTNGTAVIARQQTNGSGRNQNQWLSPAGCVMFSLQLHIPLDSVLGQRIPLVQHLIATAIVQSISNIDGGYENLDIRLKWPNDIYANGVSKIGGLIINTQVNARSATCNVGCGINLNNSTPTTCVNDLIKDYNRIHNKTLPTFGYERIIAMIFTEIERIMDRVQGGDLSYLYELYYRYWLHNHQEVTILDKHGRQKLATIIGIDEFGFLEVQTKDGRAESVHPDGNSFDMLRGLILPK